LAQGSCGPAAMSTQDELAAALLENPQVKEAMAKAGSDAMNNPDVQAAIQKAAQEQGGAIAAKLQAEGPEMAKKAMDKAMAMAGDPAVQAKAKEYAAQAGAMARQYGGQAAEQFMAKIEQGPAGVRFLAFLGSCASVGFAVMTLINPINALAFVSYIVSIYQLIFAFSTVIFECPPEYIEKVPKVKEYQELLEKKCNFLTDVGGRGMFYIFQGTLWLTMMELFDITLLALGCYLIFIGVLHVAMHYDIAPGKVAAKMRDGYAEVSSRGP